MNINRFKTLPGIVAGLPSEGLHIITATFAPFQTMRCCEQIKVNLGYMNQKVTLVGLTNGVILGTLGYTHCCIKDVAVIRSILNITIVSLANYGETVKAMFLAIHNNDRLLVFGMKFKLWVIFSNLFYPTFNLNEK